MTSRTSQRIDGLRAPVRLALFATGLAVAFGAGAGLGALVPELRATDRTTLTTVTTGTTGTSDTVTTVAHAHDMEGGS